MFEKYADNISEIDIFPVGKIFRIIFDNNLCEFRILCKNYDIFDEIREAFSVTNPGAFFSQRYGYKAESKLYQINKFGYLC